MPLLPASHYNLRDLLLEKVVGLALLLLPI